MVLYIVGAGLSSEYLTLKALQVIGRADIVYIDTYTSIAPGIDEELVRRINPRCKIVSADRHLLEENQKRIISEARNHDVVVLVPGDPFMATTHITLRLAAITAGIRVEVVHGVSGVYATIGATGLQLYRFGKTVTLVYPEEFKPHSVIEVIRENRKRNLHTLVLLELKLDEGKAMTIPEAISILLDLAREEHYDEIKDTIIIGVARAGLPDENCRAGKPSQLLGTNWPPPPHSLIVTAPRLHPVEEESLRTLCGCDNCY